MHRLAILLLLVMTSPAAAQSGADSTAATAAPAGEAPGAGSGQVRKGVKILFPGHSGVKLTRLWDAFNNCVLEDGTQFESSKEEFFEITVSIVGSNTCWGSSSRMHWKVEFLPPGTANGFAEIGIEGHGGWDPAYYSFCNNRLSGDSYPRIACRTGRQIESDTIVIGVDRQSRQLKTTLRVDGKGRSDAVKITPLADSTACVQGDATRSDRAVGSTVDLKVTSNDNDACGTEINSSNWRVEFLPAQAAKGYAEVILSGSPKLGYTVRCIESGTRRVPPDSGDIECQARSAPAEQGIGLTIHP
jgi:hypothetical protein